MNESKDKCATTALVTSDLLVRYEGGITTIGGAATQQNRSSFHLPKEQIMKPFFQFLKKQEVALTVALMWMVVWAGFAMTEAFNHIA